MGITMGRWTDIAAAEIYDKRIPVIIKTIKGKVHVGLLAGLAWKRCGALWYLVEANGDLRLHDHEQICKPAGWQP